MDINTDSKDIKGIIRNYYEQLYIKNYAIVFPIGNGQTQITKSESRRNKNLVQVYNLLIQHYIQKKKEMKYLNSFMSIKEFELIRKIFLQRQLLAKMDLLMNSTGI